MKGLDHLSSEEKLRVLGCFSIENRRLIYTQRRLICLSMYTDTWRYKEDRARLFSVVPRVRTRGSGHKLKHRRFCLNVRRLFFYCEGDWALVQVSQKFCGLSILVNTKKPSGHGPGQPAVGGPAWTGGQDKITSRSPFQPQPFCDSVKTEGKWKLQGQHPFLFSRGKYRLQLFNFRDISLPV